MLGSEYKVVLVGLSDAQLSSLPSNILGIKRTTSVSELAEIYTCAHVFVNPTYSDTYPTVNLEAQACKTPVITYRTGGSVESADESGIVEQGDIDGLYKTIIEGNVKCKSDLLLDRHSMVEKYIQVFLA